MSRQEIIKMINSLRWGSIETDSPDAGQEYEFVVGELMKLEKKEAVDILLSVIQEQNLPNDYLSKMTYPSTI